MQQHLQAEENVLFPYLKKHRFDHHYIAILKRDHETIRAIAERVQVQNDGYTVFHAFAELAE